MLPGRSISFTDGGVSLSSPGPPPLGTGAGTDNPMSHDLAYLSRPIFQALLLGGLCELFSIPLLSFQASGRIALSRLLPSWM